MWLGPCPWRPYNQPYVSGGWRGFFDFHGGGILEWGSTRSTSANGPRGKTTRRPVEYVPEGSGVVATYDNGVKLVMRETGWMGLGTCSVRYEGDEGWIETGDTGNFEIYPESLRRGRKVFQCRARTRPRTSATSWTASSRRTPANANADVAAGRTSPATRPTSPGSSAARSSSIR